MALDWFKGSKAADVNELIVRKQYPKAIELIQVELDRNSKNERLRLQLAHVLALAGKKGEAADVLDVLASELARDGFATKAVAILKKMQKVDPDREDIDERLADVIGGQVPSTPPAWEHYTGPVTEIGLDLGEPSPVVVTQGGDVVPPAEPVGSPAKSPTQVRREAALGTPLFRGMSPQEIVAVIRGLRLHSFAAGHIVVTEGQPGDSLFVITTGMCRAFVKNPSGRNVEVRELGEGDFFGEISVLTGEPRSATITTASRCELLELERANLDSILKTHPHVREVLEDFQQQRADSSVEAAIRGMRES
jgi:cAMP-dependent protein kinase regulator